MSGPRWARQPAGPEELFANDVMLHSPSGQRVHRNAAAKFNTLDSFLHMQDRLSRRQRCACR